MFQIMIVEDDPSAARLEQAILTHEGYDTILAENGARALELLDQHHVDLMVLDLMMPVMDGYGLTETLRKLSLIHIWNESDIIHHPVCG